MQEWRKEERKNWQVSPILKSEMFSQTNLYLDQFCSQGGKVGNEVNHLVSRSFFRNAVSNQIFLSRCRPNDKDPSDELKKIIKNIKK